MTPVVDLKTALTLQHVLEGYGLDRESAEVAKYIQPFGLFWNLPSSEAYRRLNPMSGSRRVKGVVVFDEAPPVWSILTVLEVYGITSDQPYDITANSQGIHVKDRSGKLLACLSFARLMPSMERLRSHVTVLRAVLQLTHLDIDIDAFVGVEELRIWRPNGAWILEATHLEPARKHPELTLILGGLS